MKSLTLLSGLALLFAAAGTALAGTTAYTDQADFLADLPGPASVLDFDSFTVNTVISDGTTLGNVTFDYVDMRGMEMQVGNGIGTSSPDWSLGTTDAYQFLAGDLFDLGFSTPTYAIGMYFMSWAPDTYDEDIRLEAAGETAYLNTADSQGQTSDGADIYFLGIIDDSASFTSAAIRYHPLAVDALLFNVDDIITVTRLSGPVVPLPSALYLGVAGMALLAALRRRRRH